MLRCGETRAHKVLALAEKGDEDELVSCCSSPEKVGRSLRRFFVLYSLRHVRGQQGRLQSWGALKKRPPARDQDPRCPEELGEEAQGYVCWGVSARVHAVQQGPEPGSSRRQLCGGG